MPLDGRDVPPYPAWLMLDALIEEGCAPYVPGGGTGVVAEGDVWGMDILIASGTDGKVRSSSSTRVLVLIRCRTPL